MTDEFFMGIARRFVGKQVRVILISGRNCPLTDGRLEGTITYVGEDFFAMSCPAISSVEDTIINPAAVALMLVPKGK
jgi:hypothetical protein